MRRSSSEREKKASLFLVALIIIFPAVLLSLLRLPHFVQGSCRMQVAIVGAGLSGLVSAYSLLKKESEIRDSVGKKCLESVSMFEAGTEAGGRLRSTVDGIDLGGSWIFSGFSATEKLCEELDVSLMKHPSMYSRDKRILGGAQRLIDKLFMQTSALAEELEVKFELNLNAKVSRVVADESTKQTTLSVGEEKVAASHVLVSIPPRVAATQIVWEPKLSDRLRSFMRNQNTWMSSMGKVAFIYDSPWWRDSSPEIDIDSLRPRGQGPIVQLLDGSSGKFGDDRESFAIVAFIAPDLYDHKTSVEDAIEQMSTITKSLGHSNAPKKVEHKLWMDDENIFTKLEGTPADHMLYYDHPRPFNKEYFRELEKNNIYVCGSETDRNTPGYIEGAVCAGRKVASEIFEPFTT